MFTIINISYNKYRSCGYRNTSTEGIFMSDEKPRRKKHKVMIMPRMQKQLEMVGEQIKLARLRRGYTMEIIAERADISRTTLWKVEHGDPGVAFGVYAKVLAAIGLPKDIELLAKDDELGRIIQDSQLLKRGSRS